jgi:hypothetical protein
VAIRFLVSGGDRKGKARRYSSRFPKWMLPNRLNLDRGFRFAVGGRRCRGLGNLRS